MSWLRFWWTAIVEERDRDLLQRALKFYLEEESFSGHPSEVQAEEILAALKEPRTAIPPVDVEP